MQKISQSGVKFLKKFFKRKRGRIWEKERNLKENIGIKMLE